MFFGREMNRPAIWTSYNEAFRVCMMIRTKRTAIVTPFITMDGVHGGYSILIKDNDVNNVGPLYTHVTKGLIYAIMQQHGVEDKDVEGWTGIPFFAAMPKEVPNSVVLQ